MNDAAAYLRISGRFSLSMRAPDDKTRLTLRTRFASTVRKLAAAEARFVISWEEALDRLAEVLPA